MGSLLSRSVVMKISNKTQNVILRKPRTYFECGSCPKEPQEDLHPDSTATWHLQGSFPFWGVAGILVYEAESFTLAIYFSNPIDYNKFSMELGLELSPGKAHEGSLASTYARMAKGTYSSSCLDNKFARITVHESRGIAQLKDGPVKVIAIMSNATSSLLEVVVEEHWRTERGNQD
ncbi:hypothetical protein Nmel_013011 [Mimus melanotis]